MRRQFGDRKISHRTFGPCMGFTFLMDANKVFLQIFYECEANYNKPLKNEKKSGIESLVLPFPDTEKYLLLFHKHPSIH